MPKAKGTAPTRTSSRIAKQSKKPEEHATKKITKEKKPKTPKSPKPKVAKKGGKKAKATSPAPAEEK